MESSPLPTEAEFRGYPEDEMASPAPPGMVAGDLRYPHQQQLPTGTSPDPSEGRFAALSTSMLEEKAGVFRGSGRSRADLIDKITRKDQARFGRKLRSQQLRNEKWGGGIDPAVVMGHRQAFGDPNVSDLERMAASPTTTSAQLASIADILKSRGEAESAATEAQNQREHERSMEQRKQEGLAKIAGDKNTRERTQWELEHRAEENQRKVDNFFTAAEQGHNRDELRVQERELEVQIQRNWDDTQWKHMQAEQEVRNSMLISFKEAGLQKDPGYFGLSSFISNSDYKRPVQLQHDPDTQDTQGEAAIFSKMGPGDVRFHVRPKQRYTKKQAEEGIGKEGEAVKDELGKYAGWQRIQVYVRNPDGSTASYGTAATPGLTHND